MLDTESRVLHAYHLSVVIGTPTPLDVVCMCVLFLFIQKKCIRLERDPLARIYISGGAPTSSVHELQEWLSIMSGLAKRLGLAQKGIRIHIPAADADAGADADAVPCNGHVL